MADTWAVSVKAVLIWLDEVILLRNDRDEWELPGDHLAHDESPEECAERAIEEELGLYATAERLLDTWVYELAGTAPELVISYGCSVNLPDPLALREEHAEVRLFPVNELDSLPLPAGYAESIKSWHRLLGR